MFFSSQCISYGARMNDISEQYFKWGNTAKVVTVFLNICVLFMVPSKTMAVEGRLESGLLNQFSGTVSLTTDYVSRGLTQNDEKPAIQGSLDWVHPKGMYLGVWGSSVDFNDGDQASTEIDGYVGYQYQWDKLFSNFSFLYYWYPGTPRRLNYDFYELHGTLGYVSDWYVLSASIFYSPDFFAASGDAQYVKGSLDIPLPNNFFLTSHFGRQWVDDNLRYGFQDYNDWSVGIKFLIEKFELNLQYLDTNIGSVSCPDGCEAKAVFSISRTF